MRTLRIVTALTACVLAKASVGAAEQPAAASSLTAVQTLTAADFPPAEPGKKAFVPQPGGQWSCAIVAHGPWVYAVQSTSYILRFKRDTATARLQYLGAVAFGTLGKEAMQVRSFCVRRLAGGGAMLYLSLLSHAGVISHWYSVDAASGGLTRKSPDGAHVLIGYELLPDQKHYYVYTGDNSFGWFEFAPDGAPVEKGRVACPVAAHYDEYLVASQDGRSVYRFANANMNIETYKCDPVTGAAAYDTSVALKAILTADGSNGASGLVALPPDGRHVYVFPNTGNNRGTRYCVLARDVTTGRLTAPSKCSLAAPQFAGMAGLGWGSREYRFAYDADGKSGYFISLKEKGWAAADFGQFNRDSASGALTLAASRPAWEVGADRLFYDPACGNLYTIGSRICAFKTSAAPFAAPAWDRPSRFSLSTSIAGRSSVPRPEPGSSGGPGVLTCSQLPHHRRSD